MWGRGRERWYVEDERERCGVRWQVYHFLCTVHRYEKDTGRKHRIFIHTDAAQVSTIWKFFYYGMYKH